MEIIERLRNDVYPGPAELIDTLVPVFPLLGEAESVEQDPQWHGEGNVRVHTEMVIAEALKLISGGDETLTREERVGLIVGAALHDIGKALTTCQKEVRGQTRIVSPKHAERGHSIVAPLISRLGLTEEERRIALGLIRYHHHPKRMVFRSSRPCRYRQLARSVNHRLIYLFEKCDLIGRVCDDLDNNLENLELFRLESESLGLWDNENPYRDWIDQITREIPDSKESDYVIGEAIRSHELGKINSPEEAIAKTWDHRRDYGTVTIMCAPAGCGKTTWIDENIISSDGRDLMILSLDDIRKEVTGGRSDQSKNGRVMQLAKEKLRAGLRRKCDIVWDSTGLRRDGRAMVAGLARNYFAATRIVTLGVHPDEANRQNKNRSNPVPASVLQKHYHQWQWPDIDEAHRVDELFFPSSDRAK